MKYLIYFICFLNSVAYAQSSWYWKNPVPSGNAAESVIFIDANAGIAVGPYGEIKRTTNNGTNWYLVASGTSKSLDGVHFLSSSIGFAVGDSGTILKSTNAGQTWAILSSGSNSFLRDVQVIDNNTVVVVGVSGTILRTTNAGSNWYFIPSGTSEALTAVHFTNTSVGYLSGEDGTILKSTTGGQNWSLQFSGTNTVDFADVFFTSTATGYIVGQSTGNIWRTTNGGTNWFTNPVGSFSNLREIYFSNFNTGFTLGTGPNHLIKTTDGGNSWSIVASDFGYSFYSFATISNNIHLIDIRGNLWHSTNEGANWANHLSGFREDVNDIDFIDSYTGFAVCDSGKIYKTSNAGNTWHFHDAFSLNNLLRIQFPTSVTGYIVGINSTILKTTNAGVNWSTISGPTGNITTLFFLDANTGSVSSPDGTWRTTDGGANWASYANYFGGLYFLNALTGIATGSGIRRTTDGGANWSIIEGAPANYVTFNNAGTGVTISQTGNPTIFGRTTNGGLDWNIFTLPFNETIYDLQFKDNNTVIAVGLNGAILASTNSGLNWYKDNRVVSARFNSVSFINDSISFIGGDFGTILSTVPNTPVGVTPISNVIPTLYSLSQNFPNPFNPSTIIKYHLPENDIIQLKVFDVNGKLVKELLNEQQSAGKYAVTFNGAGLPSGVYFYKLETQTFTATKKMVLIK